jgi:hypothetical protein
MGLGAIYIVLGASTLAWQRWLIARLRDDVRRINPTARRRYYEALMRQSGPKRVFIAVRLCGVAMMVVGVALLLNI